MRHISLPLLVLLAVTTAAYAQKAEPLTVKNAKLPGTPNVHVCGSLFFAGQPDKDSIQTLKDKGIQRVITLRTDGELDWNQAAAVEAAGMAFFKVPFRAPDSLTDDVFDRVRKLLGVRPSKPTLLHCGSANRVGAVWLAYRVLDEGVAFDVALKEAKTIGLRTDAYTAKARDYIRRRQKKAIQETSVKPGINDRFLSGDVNIDEWLGRFEVESREVFSGRDAVLAATGVKSGMHVADIGAGTGLFTRLFSEKVGEEGWVYAIDIAPKFIEHINKQAQDDGLTNVTAVLCRENSICLPPNSIDVAFICDTYHHFEYPQSTLRSIRQALRPGGSLIVIDFERIPGKTRDFLLNHVRAGKGVFRSEIEAAGFALVDEVDLEQLEENYFLRFVKK